VAASTATLAIKVTADASKAAAGLDDVAAKAGGFQSGLNKAAAAAAGAGLALAAFGTQAFEAASTAEQAAGAVDAVFGKQAATIHAWSQDSAEATGLAASEYEAMAATFGAQLKNMGVATEDLAPQTDELIGLGADLAAQFGGSTSDAVAALSSLLRGETDPIEQYGVSIRAADIEAQKAAMGLDGLTGAADKQATTQATLALLMEQTADATGAYAREQDTAAGAQKTANAQYEDAQAAIGKALLPVVSKLAGWLGKLGKLAEDNAGAFQIFMAAAAALAAAILAASVATKLYAARVPITIAMSHAWAAAQWLVNAALTANPIGIVIVAIGALIAAVVLIVKNWDKVTAALKWTWNWLKKNWPLLLTIIAGPFGLAVGLIIKNWKTVKDWFKAFGKFARDVFRAVKNVAVGAFRAVRDVAATVFGRIRDIILRLIAPIQRVIGWLRSNLVAAWRAVRDVAASIFGRIRELIQTVIEKVRSLIAFLRDNLNAMWRTVRDVAKAVFDAIKGYIQWPIDKAKALVAYLRDTLKPIWDTIKTAADNALGPIEDAIDGIKDALDAVIDAVESLIDWIKDIPVPSIDWPEPPSWVPIVGGSAAPAPARYAAPTVAARGTAGGRATASSAPITINVNGALDPDAVARQIGRIVRARSRRVGGVGRLAGAL
jgi:phage-related protein